MSHYPGKHFDRDKDFYLRSTVSGVIELMDYNYFIRLDKFNELNLFYVDIAREIYRTRTKNYNYGFRVIEPLVMIISDRIYLLSFLYHEKQVPELSTAIFKLFAEYLSMILSLALKHEIVIRGYASIGSGVEMLSESGISMTLPKADNLVLSDMLKVFSFEEIFPEGLDQQKIPPVNLYSAHAGNFAHSCRQLDAIDSIGIFMPGETMEHTSTEVAIYSGMLTEVSKDGKIFFSVSWKHWTERHPDCVTIQEIMQSIARLSESKEYDLAEWWKRLREIS